MPSTLPKRTRKLDLKERALGRAAREGPHQQGAERRKGLFVEDSASRDRRLRAAPILFKKELDHQLGAEVQLADSLPHLLYVEFEAASSKRSSAND